MERGDYKDLLKRLDEGATDEKTNDDRDYLTCWFLGYIYHVWDEI